MIVFVTTIKHGCILMNRISTQQFPRKDHDFLTLTNEITSNNLNVLLNAALPLKVSFFKINRYNYEGGYLRTVLRGEATKMGNTSKI